jgi:hypothetical protein
MAKWDLLIMFGCSPRVPIQVVLFADPESFGRSATLRQIKWYQRDSNIDMLQCHMALKL